MKILDHQRRFLNAAKKIEPSFTVSGVLPYNGEFKVESFDDDVDEANHVLGMIKKSYYKWAP